MTCFGVQDPWRRFDRNLPRSSAACGRAPRSAHVVRAAFDDPRRDERDRRHASLEFDGARRARRRASATLAGSAPRAEPTRYLPFFGIVLSASHFATLAGSALSSRGVLSFGGEM